MGEPEQKQPQTALAEASMFTESGIRILSIYRFWIVAAAWLATRAYAMWGLLPNYYVNGYLEIAGDWLGGFIPYAAFKVEYPPGALLLFVLPRIFSQEPIVYGYVLAAVMLLADLGVLLFLWRMPALVFGSDLKTDRGRRYGPPVLCLIYILLTAVFGRLLFQHYDLIIGLLLVAVIYFSLRKNTTTVDVLLAVGIWLNLSVLFWIPLLWWYGFVCQEGPPTSKSFLRITQFMRTLLPRAAVLVGSLGVLFVPFILLSGRSMGFIVQYHLERGLQVESLAAGILMVAAKVFDFELTTELTHRAIHLSGEFAGRWAVASGILSVIVFVILTIYLTRMIQRQHDASTRRIWLIKGLLASLLALLLTSKAFMPQYLLWIAPLAALLACGDDSRNRYIGWRLFVLNLLSAVLFFFFYSELIKLDLLPAVLLLIRNFLGVWLVAALLLPAKPAADQGEPMLPLSPPARKYLIYVPAVLLLAWGSVAAFCPLNTNDLWLLLREAGDIVASGEIPRVEQYSAVAAGRPYIAHEWLSGLIFLGVFKIGGGQALTVFRAMTMLAILLLLWFSLEKRARRFVLAAPLLALATYIILERMFVRPHAFTLLFLGVWVFCMERWRRRRRLGYLVLLVPLQIIWANLHGGYIMAVIFGATMTAGAAFFVLFPSWSKDESYVWSDVRKLALLTAACMAASLINPYGLRLLEFSLNLGVASDYIKQFVYEWGSPFTDSYWNRAYGSDVALSIFILMWTGLALNVKRRPLLDVLLALLATVMTAQAIRFVSFIGILGFPITVRAWLAVADAHAKSLPVKRRALIETALFGLLLASTLIYGFPYEKAKHRDVGWGFGGRMPHEATRFMAQQGFEGAIFNDYGDGAYLIYHLYPKIRPVMDSRIDVYGNELSREYFSSLHDPIRFFRYLNKYNVSFILLRKSRGNARVIEFLSRLPASKLLLATDHRLLFSYDSKRLPPEIMQKLGP